MSHPVEPRRRRTPADVALVVLGIGLGLALAAALLTVPAVRDAIGVAGGVAREAPAAGAPLHTCPMHPQILQEEPGSCPICGMDLVPVEDDAGQPPPAPGAPLHTCPMHPQILQEEPGSCPICGMDLVPVEDEGAVAPAGNAVAGRRQGAEVRIDPTVVQNMNVTTATVRRHDLERRIRTIGSLEYDLDHMVTVTTKYPGFIENVQVNYLGQPVRRGDVLFEVYAPELVQTQQELLSAVRYADRLEATSRPAHRRARALVEAARDRLAYWDVTDDQVDRIVRTGEPMRTLAVVAPASGVVMKIIHGLEGMRIQPGMDVVHIAGLDPLWLRVEVFEDQVRYVGVGDAARVTFAAFPGEIFRGTVRYVEPEVAERTRTLRLTLEIPNPSQRLRVGMYATVVFEPVVVQDAVAVPSQAVLRTGERAVVVVSLGGGRFAPREVTLGVTADEMVHVLDGLDAGETIVTSSQFLIDSESNLREAIRAMRAETAGGGHAGH